MNVLSMTGQQSTLSLIYQSTAVYVFESFVSQHNMKQLPPDHETRGRRGKEGMFFVCDSTLVAQNDS